MAKPSFYVGLFAVLYILASGLLASGARDSRQCSRDVDCTWVCRHGGFCYENGTCSCLPPPSGELAVIRCKSDVECYFQCPKGGFCDLKKGICGCLRAAGTGSSTGAPAAAVTDATHCKRDADCEQECSSPKVGFCDNGSCYCFPEAKRRG